MYQTLRTGTRSSASATLALLYDIGNQVLNAALLLLTAVGIYRLRRIDVDLFLNCLIVAVPLLFLGRNQYMLSSSLGRQFLIASLAILGFGRPREAPERDEGGPAERWGLSALYVAMLALGVFWTVLYSTFFLHYRLF
jgi:hypothetical protein